ncbi:MAG: DUF3341 domain-containing protein [Chloroflexi bacterium]|nr:DUF3341 domain-containing protein [Chloroflexota bacterium]
MRKRSVLGVFGTAEAAAHATSQLREAGFAAQDYDILTGTPYPEGAFGEHDPGHKLFIFPLIGAVVGFSIAVLFTVGTQLSYPLVSGGKPIIAVPAMSMILYEGTMLGALTFTFLGVIFESRLPRLKLDPYDTRITEGAIGVIVSVEENRLGVAEGVFRRVGAENIVREGQSSSQTGR